MPDTAPPPDKIAFIGTSPPRQCGIATFAADLRDGIRSVRKDADLSVVAVTEAEASYPYGPAVHFEMRERDIASYRRAAEFLNVNNFSLACLQHEYGLYGGPAGSHVLALLRDLRMPVVTTLHTVIQKPDAHQATVTRELVRLSARLVVLSRRAADLLQTVYQVPPDKIDLIPHGVPDVPFVDPNFYKDHFGVEGKTVILTFGLLGPDKGIEYVIEAMPGILARHRDVVYLIVGATHPALRRQQGEAYRMSLERLAQKRSVAGSLIFHNRFVTQAELIDFLCAADIYITPYLQPQQVSSGTLSYAMGVGKAIVSTPYWYAEEMLADGRGLLVPFRDAKAVAARITELLDNETERHAMRKRAYLVGHEMVWPRVAEQYLQAFDKARQDRLHHVKAAFAVKTLGDRPQELPPLNLAHLRRMTDHTGMLQHAIFAVPNYNHGYCTDDNARALILATLLEEIAEFSVHQVADLKTRYMAFVWAAFDPDKQVFRNFFSYDRRWVDDAVMPDCHARTLWALGTVLGRSDNEALRGIAGQLFDTALKAATEFPAPRCWAFTLLGIHEYLRRFFGARLAQDAREQLAAKLLERFATTAADDWVWFEDSLTYDNAKLPHAMILCGRWMNRDDMLDAGLRSLAWLCKIQQSDEGHFVPIGTEGFWKRGQPRPRFDQQPLEAHSTVSACLEAYRTTGDTKWRSEAQRAFDWFLGRNDLHVPLYDPTTGGCRDGLRPDRPNENQGAESTLAFLMSLAEMRLAESMIME